jgi:hypothetical protein
MWSLVDHARGQNYRDVMVKIGGVIHAAFSTFGRTSGLAALAAGVLVSLPFAGTTARAGDEPSWLAYAATPVVKGVRTPRAAAGAKSSHEADKEEVDTEHIFGFSMGSDIGEKGELELEFENIGTFGKRTGSYSAFSGQTQLKYTLTDNFGIAPGFTLNSNRIKGVEGFDDVGRTSVGGASVEMRYKVLDREKAPFGLTLRVQPGWNRIDDATGLCVEQYGNEFLLLMDKEIIKDRLYGAINIGYGVAATRLKATNAWSHDSDLSIQGAVSYGFFKGFLAGAEIRYLRAYDGLGLDRFKGDAVYLGPTFSTKLAKNVGLSGTVNFQVAGKALDDPRSLDLVNFERVQAMLRLNILF